MNNKQAQILVLGSGCPTCKKFFKIVEQAAAEINPELKVEYTDEIQKIIDMGMMQSPVLAINGKPIIAGFTSDVGKIKKAIKDNI